jgi:hypothetical protein
MSTTGPCGTPESRSLVDAPENGFFGETFRRVSEESSRGTCVMNK